MVNRNLIRDLEDAELRDLCNAEIATIDEGDAMLPLIDQETDFDVNMIVDGKILRVDDENVLVDVGFKSEGSIPLNEWEEDEDPPEVGQVIKVLIEDVEDEFGMTDDPIRRQFRIALEQRGYNRHKAFVLSANKCQGKLVLVAACRG